MFSYESFKIRGMTESACFLTRLSHPFFRIVTISGWTIISNITIIQTLTGILFWNCLHSLHVSFNIFWGSKSLGFFFSISLIALFPKKSFITTGTSLTHPCLQANSSIVEFSLTLVKGRSFLWPLFPIYCPALLRGGKSGSQICKLPQTDQSDEDKVANEGGPSFRIAHPLNLFHSALLSFAKMSLQKLTYF